MRNADALPGENPFCRFRFLFAFSVMPGSLDAIPFGYRPSRNIGRAGTVALLQTRASINEEPLFEIRNPLALVGNEIEPCVGAGSRLFGKSPLSGTKQNHGTPRGL